MRGLLLPRSFGLASFRARQDADEARDRRLTTGGGRVVSAVRGAVRKSLGILRMKV